MNASYLGSLLALLLVCAKSNGYIESVAASVGSTTDDAPLRRQQQTTFLPLVAFKCGYRNQYLSTSGAWTSDSDKHAVCLTGKLDILKYCRKVYPQLDVTNIVEYNHQTLLPNWCKERGSPCKWTYTVRPYQCLVGEFRSEALQVPRGCKFGHVDDRQLCDDFAHWEATAAEQCVTRQAGGRPMQVRSFSVLEPCGLDIFSGVEFVCCPSADAATTATPPVPPSTPPADSKDSDEYDDDYYDDDDYDDDDEDEDYDDDDDEDDSDYDKDVDESTDEQDTYFRTSDPDNEHDNYKAALGRLDQAHRDKVAKVMNEWSQLDKRYRDMKSKDPKYAAQFNKEMNDRLQKTVAALEEENAEQRAEIVAVHEERVQAALNERKRQAISEYREALALTMDAPNNHQLLHTLKAYIRAEEKDRTHMLNRYRHLLRTDAEAAAGVRAEILKRLRDVDLRINGTVAMLHDFPDVDAKVRPLVVEWWQEYRRENTPEVSEYALTSLGADASRLLDHFKLESEQLQQHDTKQLHIEVERLVDATPPPPPLVEHKESKQASPAFARHSPLAHDQHVLSVGRAPGATTASSALLGIAGCAMAVALVAAVVLVARRRRPTRGRFVKVDACTPEEKHVANMQNSGYENPTFRYFERA